MKKLVAKVGEYQKDGQTKGRYENLGVIQQGNDGEYMLLNPNVSLAGVLASQNIMAVNAGKPLRDRIMVNIWEDQQQQQQQPQQNYQQPARQPDPNQAPSGYQQPQQNYQQLPQGSDNW